MGLKEKKAAGVSMEWGSNRRTVDVPWRASRCAGFLAAICALTLAGCNPDNQNLSVAQPRGATVAFDSVDGLPPAQFQKLVQNLNDEAQTRHLAVMSREQSSVYRVRGYLAVKVTKRQTTVAWVWDVYDQDEHRALRISGEETTKVRHRDVWSAADDAMLRRIAHASMEQLSVFLISPEVAPGATPPTADPQVAMADTAASSPESAGIFRMQRPEIDPAPTGVADAVTGAENADAVPVPRRRPSAAAVLSERETVKLSALSR